ncbi:hypothetical protein GBA52_018983 [Prunus armeniaca]|nr:hypothetical protein GBA52_018983 [Prunus armeniaca]
MDEVPEEIRPKRTKRWMEATPGDNYIPEEVIHDILLRLPSKSLLKCTTVCKSWRSLIRSSAFIHTHLSHAIIKSNNQNDDAQLLLLVFQCNSVIALGSQPFISEYSKLVNPFVAYNELQGRPKDNLDLRVRTVKVVETCNGLVCLHHRLTTLIWNPRIRKFVILPQGTVSASQYDPRSYSFGYDSRTDDCKVLRFVRERRVSCAVELCSLARGSWRSVVTPNFVDEMLPSTMFGPVIEPAFVNGAMHWIQDRVDENVILSFDLSTESFGKILLPNADSRIKFRMFVDFYCVSRCGDSLAFFENNRIRSTALVSLMEMRSSSMIVVTFTCGR